MDKNRVAGSIKEIKGAAKDSGRQGTWRRKIAERRQDRTS